MTTTEKTLEQRLAEAAVADGAVLAARAAVKAVRVQAREDRHVVADVVAELTAEVLDTGRWPDDAAERLLTARRRNEEAQALGQLLWRVGDKLKRKTDADARGRVGPQVEVLREEFDAIVARVRDLDAVLGDVRSAEQAVRATSDQASAWTELPSLADRWAHVIRLHRRVVLGYDSGLSQVYLGQVPYLGAGDGDQYPSAERLRELCTRDDIELHLPDSVERGSAAPPGAKKGVVMHGVDGQMVGYSEGFFDHDHDDDQRVEYVGPDD